MQISPTSIPDNECDLFQNVWITSGNEINIRYIRFFYSEW